jgi:glycosyltransferase involved in cell wall biosynthesis
MKIIIINHTFQKPEFSKRWSAFASTYKDIDVTLLAPLEWRWGSQKSLTFGTVENIKGSEIKKENFRIKLIRTKINKVVGDWTSKDLLTEIKINEPDIVYFIGGYTSAALMQLIRLKKKHKKFKLMAFSMRGHKLALESTNEVHSVANLLKDTMKKIILYPRLQKFLKNCDAVFCHYPVALEAFRKEGYSKPVYIQTQVGVDPDIFYPNEISRNLIRTKYKVGDSFLFGSASRFHLSKGLLNVIDALPSEGNWKYLIMGWGLPGEVETIKRKVEEKNYQDRVIFTGYIDNWTEMAAHWNSLDCAIHFPSTTEKWVETFSLALVQAMITGCPIIGSSSGSIPYQLGEKGIIASENDINALRDKMLDLMENPQKCKEIGIEMRKRALSSFSIYHLNECFYHTIYDVLDDKYDLGKIDMSNFVFKTE